MTDAFDLHAAQIVGGSPDVRDWPATATITKVSCGITGITVHFDKQAEWPDAHVPGWGGPGDPGTIQYTLWLFVFRDGWQGAGTVEFWRGRESSGGYPQSSLAAHLSENWCKDGGWPQTIQPGEPIGLMVTAGDQRKKDVHVVAQRSQVVCVPVQDVGTWTFASAPPPADPPPSDPPPVDPPVPPSVPDYSARFDALETKLATLTAAVVACASQIALVQRSVDAPPAYTGKFAFGAMRFVPEPKK